MVRLHRNHASLFFWEPILNETHYPEYYAKRVLEICREEYPHPYSEVACDYGAAGDQYYSLLLRPVDGKLRNDKSYTYRKEKERVGMPSPIIRFADAYHFMEWKAKARAGKHDEAYLLAEGLVNGQVVATHKRYPAGQAHHLQLRLDDDGQPLRADGSDAVVVIAEMVDKRGNVKRLNNSLIRFAVEGERRLLGDAVVGVNPAPVVWGSAPALIRSTLRAGKIRVNASMLLPGSCRPIEDTLEFESVPAAYTLLYNACEAQAHSPFTC